MMSALVMLLALVVLAVLVAAAAQADFGIKEFDVAFENEDGSVDTQAGSHPYEMTTDFGVNMDAEGESEGTLRDLNVDLSPGLLVTPPRFPRCTMLDFRLGFVFGCDVVPPL